MPALGSDVPTGVMTLTWSTVTRGDTTGLALTASVRVLATNVKPVTDPTNGLTFPDVSQGGELLQNNLIMPEPCPFLSPDFPICSIVRPTETEGAAMGALAALTGMGLFIGQSDKFFDYLHDLAADADAARREG